MHRKFSDFTVSIDGVCIALVSGSADFYPDGSVRRLVVDPVVLDQKPLIIDNDALIAERVALELKYGQRFQPHWCRATRSYSRRYEIFQTISECIEAQLRGRQVDDASSSRSRNRAPSLVFASAR